MELTKSQLDAIDMLATIVKREGVVNPSFVGTDEEELAINCLLLAVVTDNRLFLDALEAKLEALGLTLGV